MQGVLLKPLLKRFTPQQLAVVGLSSGALSYLGFGLATQGWMMYVVILLELAGRCGTAAMQSIVSNAADPTRQGQTMGAVASLNSLMAVVAPRGRAELLRLVSHLPPRRLADRPAVLLLRRAAGHGRAHSPGASSAPTTSLAQPQPA